MGQVEVFSGKPIKDRSVAKELRGIAEELRRIAKELRRISKTIFDNQLRLENAINWMIEITARKSIEDKYGQMYSES